MMIKREDLIKIITKGLYAEGVVFISRDIAEIALGFRVYIDKSLGEKSLKASPDTLNINGLKVSVVFNFREDNYQLIRV